MYKCDKTETSLSILSMGMKRFKQWRSTTISNLRKHVLVPTRRSGHANNNSSLTFLYIFIYLLYEICCVRKDPKVFEGRVFGQVPSLQSASRVQQKKCLVFNSVCTHCPCQYICRMVPHRLSVLFETRLRCLEISFHESFDKRWRQKWREKEEESSAVFTVWSLWGILLPWPAPA